MGAVVGDVFVRLLSVLNDLNSCELAKVTISFHMRIGDENCDLDER